MSTFRNKVSITHIGTATAILTIDGINFITDPFLSPAGTTYPTEAGHTLMVHDDPALTLEQLPHIDAVLLSHENHPDNLDEIGRKLLNGRHVFTTNDGARNLAPRPSVIGFNDWEERDVHIGGKKFHITATPCKHWPGHECVGFILHTEDFGVAPDGRPNAVYFSGDTVYVEELAKMAEKYHIAIALMNLGKATFDDLQITMDGHQAARLFRDIKADVLVPMHYESWDHFTQDGEALAEEFKAEGMFEKVRWLKPVLAGFFVIMNSWGIIISFGVFQTYYVTNLHRSPSDISWIGSLTVFLLFSVGIASGRLTDAGYFYPTVLSGAFLIVFGTFMVSLCTSYWQLLLAQGICIGLGNGLMLTPIMTIISTYFRKKLPIAMGIAACGSVTGGLIFPSMARTLLPTVGFGWTLRAIGFIQFGTLALALVVLRPRLVPKAAQDLVDWSAFRTLEFNFFILGSFFSFLGVFFGFFYLSAYARNILGLPYTESLNLLLVLNGIGFIGRLLPSILARRFGTLNAFIGLLLGSSLSMYTWIAVHSIPRLYIWTVFYSIFVGGVQSLLPVATAAFCPDLQKLGSRMGIVFAAIGIGALIGSPISGMLISKNGGSYLGAQVFSGSCLAIGALFTLAAREVKRRKSPGYFWMKI
ncbi:major facilitator superfamily transporter protein [Rutstroemia sp. NJR-2017a WRK4]|nr:major facilitator superfamily transporter protein [Rutstroemia sp. NJR-2017a WRK4]